MLYFLADKLARVDDGRRSLYRQIWSTVRAYTHTPPLDAETYKPVWVVLLYRYIYNIHATLPGVQGDLSSLSTTLARLIQGPFQSSLIITQDNAKSFVAQTIHFKCVSLSVYINRQLYLTRNWQKMVPTRSCGWHPVSGTAFSGRFFFSPFLLGGTR